MAADGESDGSWRLAEEQGLRVVRIPTTGGPAGARNSGARAAKGDLLFFIDADTTMQPDAVCQVVDIFTREPDVTALFGSYDDAPSAPNFLSQYRNLLHHYVHQTGSEDASTFWGACGAIRRDVFLALGGFDQKRYRRPCIEDIELGGRLKRAGYTIRLCKTIQVKHMKRWGVFSILKTDFFQRALPWTELILNDRQFINDLNVDASSRISVMLTHGIPAALLGALWQPGCLIIAAVLGLALLRINAPLYRFFLRKRGAWFAVKVIPWHWLYFFYSGLAFFVGLVAYSLGRRMKKIES